MPEDPVGMRWQQRAELSSAVTNPPAETFLKCPRANPYNHVASLYSHGLARATFEWTDRWSLLVVPVYVQNPSKVEVIYAAPCF